MQAELDNGRAELELNYHRRLSEFLKSTFVVDSETVNGSSAELKVKVLREGAAKGSSKELLVEMLNREGNWRFSSLAWLNTLLFAEEDQSGTEG